MALKKHLPPFPDKQACVELHREFGRLTFAGQIREALAIAVTQFQLGFDRHTHQAMNLFYGEKGKVGRFAENEHIAASPAHQGSVAQHELMCLPVLGLIGALATEQLGLQGETRHATQIYNMRRAQGLQIAVHDGGELLAELSSLAQRVNNGGADEKSAKTRLERQICEFGLRLAFRTVELYRSQSKQERQYAKAIADVRQELLAPGADGLPLGMVALEERAEGLLGRLAIKYDIHHLTPQSDHALARLLYSYDQVEFEQCFASFNGKLAKNVENIQSVLHFIEHAGKGGAAPLAQGTSPLLVSGMWYAERELPAVFNAIREGDKVERAFALAAAGLTYETNLVFSLSGIPVCLDRDAILRRHFTAGMSEHQALRVESAATERLARELEISQTQKRFYAANQPAICCEKPEISAQQLCWLYGTAMQWVRGPAAASFTPPDKALVYTRRLDPNFEYRVIHSASHLNSEGAPKLVPALLGRAQPRFAN